MSRMVRSQSKVLVSGARKLRTRRAENLATFWGAVGISQSVGCRIERRMRIQPHAGILLALRLRGALDDGQLATLGQAVAGNCDPGRAEGEVVDRVLRNPASYRQSRGENQSVFWRRLGITQSGGSRYENGMPMPEAIQLMIAGLALGIITPDLLEVVRER